MATVRSEVLAALIINTLFILPVLPKGAKYFWVFRSDNLSTYIFKIEMRFVVHCGFGLLLDHGMFATAPLKASKRIWRRSHFVE